MSIPWTLQKYIFREMGKTFLLTAAALTAVLGLGGGVLEMIELGEVTAGQLLRLMGLVLPVAAALTLPVAALFSAAATYGRLSGDNEFVACRSSGINLHILFLPAVALSLASASVTFVFVNFLIPGMVRNLNEFVSADIGALIQQRLARPKGITLGGKYRIYADDTEVNAAEQDRVVLNRVAFVEVEGEEWVRYGTARQVDLRFDRDHARARAAGTMLGLSFYDRRAGRFTDLAEQSIPGNELPSMVPLQVKFLNLAELVGYWRAPGTWHEVSDAFAKLRGTVGRRMAYDELLQLRERDGRFVLRDGSTQYTVVFASVERAPRDAGLEMKDVTIEEERAGKQRTFRAERASLDVTRGDQLSDSGVRIEAFEVRVRDGASTVERAKEIFGPVPLAAEFLQRVDGLGEAQLLAAATTAAEGEPLRDRADRAQTVLGNTLRRIKATLSERTAFSLSVIVLVILGAGLGIVFRGAHVVVAFGISFVPSLALIMTIVTGRQMACNASTHAWGLAMIWSGLMAFALLDWWTLAKWVRR